MASLTACDKSVQLSASCIFCCVAFVLKHGAAFSDAIPLEVGVTIRLCQGSRMHILLLKWGPRRLGIVRPRRQEPRTHRQTQGSLALPTLPVSDKNKV